MPESDPRDLAHLHYWIDPERLARWLMIRKQKDHMSEHEGQGIEYTPLDADRAISQARAMTDVVNLLLQVKASITWLIKAGYQNDAAMQKHVLNPLFAFYDRHRKALPDNPPPFDVAVDLETEATAQSEFTAELPPEPEEP
jgi:hypothetical protein